MSARTVAYPFTRLHRFRLTKTPTCPSGFASSTFRMSCESISSYQEDARSVTQGAAMAIGKNRTATAAKLARIGEDPRVAVMAELRRGIEAAYRVIRSTD